MAGLEFCDRTREGGKEKGREKIELLACDLRPIITRHVLPACVFLLFLFLPFFFHFCFFVSRPSLLLGMIEMGWGLVD